jgi:hypothetical protein
MARHTAYKMFRLRKDGTLGPLFINARQRIPVGEWLTAEDHPTKGFAHRPGWHCCFQAEAPHLKLKDDRVWALVTVEDWQKYDRPESQGGSWILANRLRVEAVLDNMRGVTC